MTEGRRKEFAEFSDFRDPAKRALIPDPQAIATFTNSKLDWSELEERPPTSKRSGFTATSSGFAKPS